MLKHVYNTYQSANILDPTVVILSSATMWETKKKERNLLPDTIKMVSGASLMQQLFLKPALRSQVSITPARKY